MIRRAIVPRVALGLLLAGCMTFGGLTPAQRARAMPDGAGFGFDGNRPSRCRRLRASLRARRIASAFSRAFLSEGFS